MTTSALPLGLRGSYYEAMVPDTLDLADHAELGLRHFSAITYEEHDYDMFMGWSYRPYYPPGVINQVTSVGACEAKAMEAMAYLRTVTGSHVHLEREARMVAMMVSLLGDDGLHWVPGGDPNRFWLNLVPEPLAMTHGQGRIMKAMLAWYQYTGDPEWRGRIDRLVYGLDRHMVVHKEGYAYVPTGGYHEEEYLRSCYTRRGWKNTAEPADEKRGEEGSLFNHQGHLPGVLANWAVMSGNEQALRLAGDLVRFLTKPRFWAGWEAGEYPYVCGPEHAHWRGHFHGHVNTLTAILEYAIATNDARLKAFVRDGYEWARQIGLARIGYVGDGQGCGCGRLIGLAIKLTDDGVGDYWEDVDQYIRNHGVEMQFVPEDADYLHRVAEGTPDAPFGVSRDRIIEQAVGGFSNWPTKGCYFLCCGSWGNLGLYYAWDGIVRYRDGTAQVNLLLNRASPWLDVQGYEPYEGKVVISNKTARELLVRLPLWADRKAVRCMVGEQEAPRLWSGRYLRFEGLRPGDEVTVEYPMVETREAWTVPTPEELMLYHQFAPDEPPFEPVTHHTIHFRGNTVISITPDLVRDAPLYTRRGHLARERAPMKSATRYVAPIVLRW